jgi:muramidase (phage lysozyme)
MILETLAVAALLHLPPAERDPRWMQPSRSAPSAAVNFGKCVIRHESRNVGGPVAENPRSTASGLFQLLDGTWRHYAAHVPSARKYRHAASAPASVQWEVFLLAFKWHGQRNWAGTSCGYGT